MEHRARAAVVHRDLHKNVARLDLGVLDEHIEVAVFREYAGIQQFVFRHIGAAPRILRNQISVRKCSVWIFVEHL